ncbi:MAG: hypothetical protein FLDDKLPJ_01959 [Phycisphaerae bacterium]|nr:hypothetical protein [Phycisphaerae bacterium]
MSHIALSDSGAACRVRPVRNDDVPGLLDLIRGVYAEYGQTLYPDEEPHVFDPGAYFRGHGGEFWVADVGGTIVATCGVKRVGDDAELKTLYVHAAHRRQGLARRLVDLCIAHAASRDARRLILWSDTRFLDAHRLYRRLGFTLDGLRELKDSNFTWEFGFFKPL